MKIRRRKADIVFSQLVRTRDDWTCRNCGATENIDCAHIMGRRHVGLRHHPVNALALCRGCHMFFGEHPFDFYDFVKKELGENLLAELRLVASKPVKWTARQREEIYQHMKCEADKQCCGDDFAQHELMHDFGQ